MNAIEKVTALVEKMAERADRVAAIEAELREAKEAHRRIAEEDLPEMLRELGLQEMTLTNGLKVQVEELVSCAITAERRGEAHEWLRQHGFGGLIKILVEVPFAKGEEERAAALYAELADKDYPVEAEETVHPQTLKAFVREQLGDGASLPLELFGIHPYSRAKISAVKGKR